MFDAVGDHGHFDIVRSGDLNDFGDALFDGFRSAGEISS